MPFRLGWPELLVILAIILLLFGGRLTKSASELAKGIKIFQKTLKEDDDDDDDNDDGNVVKEETKKKDE